jgi:hypothetical protein
MTEGAPSYLTYMDSVELPLWRETRELLTLCVSVRFREVQIFPLCLASPAAISRRHVRWLHLAPICRVEYLFFSLGQVPTADLTMPHQPTSQTTTRDICITSHGDGGGGVQPAHFSQGKPPPPAAQSSFAVSKFLFQSNARWTNRFDFRGRLKLACGMFRYIALFH